MNYNQILGYIFTVFNYIFYCSSRFRKKKTKMLSMDLLAKLSMILALYFLESLSGSYSMMVSFTILIVANIKEKNEKTWTLGYLFFEAVLIGILIIKFEGISSILVFMTSSISLLSLWWLLPQKMRIASLITSITSLLYQLSILNFAGLLEIIVISSNILSYLRYREKI